VQDHDVGWLDLVAVPGDVDPEPAGHPVRQSLLVQEPACLGLVRAGQLQVGGVRGAAAQHLDLELTQAATDLEDRGPLQALALEEGEHAALGAAEPLATVVPGDLAGEALAEHVLVAPWVAAARHLRAPSPSRQYAVAPVGREPVRSDRDENGP
jgi:hypothetical protein